MKKIGVITTGLLLFLTVSAAMADVTLETVVKSEGLKGFAAHEGTLVSRIQGIKMAEADSIKFTGAILSRLAGGDEKVTISRVDKGVVWVLDAKNKTYTETVIAPPDRSEGGPLSSEGGPPSSGAGDKEGVKPRMVVTKSEFTVKKTGASENINGFPCEEYLLNWLIEMEAVETKAKIKNNMATRLWTTPETSAIRKLNEEQNTFRLAYMKKLGMDISPEEMKQFGMDMLAASGASQTELKKEFAKLKKEMLKLKGYPIRTVVAWHSGGDGAPKTVKKDSTDREKEQPAVSIGKFLGGLQGAINKKMGGTDSKQTSDGPLFSGTTEIKSIDVGSISASAFDIPSGYVRK